MESVLSFNFGSRDRLYLSKVNGRINIFAVVTLVK